jgi:hypothetical protein
VTQPSALPFSGIDSVGRAVQSPPEAAMNFSSLQLKIFAAILFVSANAMNQANAQAVGPAREERVPLPTPELPKSAPTLDRQLRFMKPGHKLILVTSKDPTVKRTCHLDSASVDEIRCQQPFHTQSAIYRMADLDTVIDPAVSHFYFWNFFVMLAYGGGIITGACFLGAISAVAIIGAVPIAIIGGFFVLAAPLMSVDEVAQPRLLYQKPGTTLAVKLR